MGVSNSKMEDDKALLLCRERRRFVRQALDGRCSLAVAHVSYIQSLRSTGTALRKFVESDAPAESSLNTSTSATPEPLSLTEKSASQISNVETVESCSPVPSPLSSARIHVNNMKAFRSFTTTIKEKPPTPVIATLQTDVSTPKGTTSLTDEDSTAETPPPPGTPPWDYFELFHPIDNQFSFQDGPDANLGLDNSSYISRLREEEGIPELEEEGENVSSNGRDDFGSEDDFDQPSVEPLVQMFKNRNEVLDSNPIRDSLSEEKVALGTKQLNQEKLIVTNGMHEPDETAPQPPPKEPSSAVILPIDGHEKQHVSANKLAPKDLMSCIWEIEDLFIKASESGKEVPRMLEAYKVNFRPLFAEYKAHRSRASSYLTSCVGWCGEETQLHEEPAANETKYLTWHRSESSLSSSRNLIGVTSKDDGDNFNDSILSNRFMNSGSHASTLDRLYAWERKLYDEVKASGVIRREYDAKCRLLRHQESRGESQYKIDKTRAKVKDLHSRVKVSIQRIDSISKKIEELRDTELQPQLEELIEGIAQMWERMLDCHKHQCSIISSASNIGSIKISSRSESYRQVATLLTFELNSLCSSFIKWISVHKSYLEAINGWLHKCVFPLRHKNSRGRRNLEFSPRRDRAPPIFVTCRDWLKMLTDLPTSEVERAIKNLSAISTDFLPHQEKVHGNTKLLFSLSKKAGKYEELVEDIQRNVATPDSYLDLNRFQSGLAGLLYQLKAYAESSVQNYGALQMSIEAAREAYEKD